MVKGGKLRIEWPPPGTPADTMEAIRAEIARVRQLPPAELAKLGTKYTDPEALWEALGALNGEATRILRATWVKTQRGGRLPKRGDKLPSEALITVQELREIHAKALALPRNDPKGGPTRSTHAATSRYPPGQRRSGRERKARRRDEEAA